MTAPRAGRARRFRAARGGNVAILVALGSAMLMGAGAVGIDLGMVFQARRKAQGAVDIAAMLAAVDPAQADTAARRSLGDNGYATATATVSPGSYDASAPGTAPGSRFKAGGSPANAVRVGLSTSVPVTFGRAIGLPAAVPLRVTGTAASAQFAAFTIGSGTLQLQGGIANALLGALLGAKLSLSVSDYDALASARVDGLRVLDALGASLNMQAANYTDIVQAQASVGQMLMALRVAAQDNGSVVSALSGILNALPNAGNLIAIGQVDGLGDAAALAPPRGFAGPSLNVLNLLGAAAALANGQNQVAVDLGATIPGLLATRLTLAIGERKRSSGWVRPGSPNATVQTAQTRLLIEATVTAPLGLGSLTLPVYAEVAPAQATLRSLTCAGPSGRQVTLDAQTGLATLAIAGVPRTAINGGSTGPDLSQPAPLIALPLITVSGRALVTLGTGAQTLTFSEADIANHTVRSVASGNLTQSLTGSLLRNLTLNINGIGVAPLLQSALTTTLGAVAPAIDLVLDNVLRSLGLRLGYADLDVDGTLCSQAVLVQ
ncbi:membrane Transport [Methylobacterium phyllosphaerae]|uniref:Membrane Transport n=1 Tax=Methylobacterium phyllosphaerae TaxID=418223 RepID=A0AAE8HTB2_9HYPH|nr:TadG family pilus assembly protein [Methylobacterium phyllosphaerae]APT31233.1 membrane Transport [Methylobacterium phyllosphaerae]MDH3030762.1 TadG family pilus assembly protein [Methylobacterium fujisawaense]SFH11356.1 Uncharacterized membrane protein [Methylobacterium phyllosphaerae]